MGIYVGKVVKFDGKMCGFLGDGFFFYFKVVSDVICWE